MSVNKSVTVPLGNLPGRTGRSREGSRPVIPFRGLGSDNSVRLESFAATCARGYKTSCRTHGRVAPTGCSLARVFRNFA